MSQTPERSWTSEQYMWAAEQLLEEAELREPELNLQKAIAYALISIAENLEQIAQHYNL